VSPVADAVNVTAVPTVPVVGPEMDTVCGSGAIAIVADAVAVFALESVTVTVTVWEPLTL
jgi:diaminopimelate epimerase